MININCRVISFKQEANENEEIYFLSTRQLEMGCYYYHRDLGRFYCVQRVLHESQLSFNHPRIEATTNDKYEIKKVPPVFAEHYFKTGKTIKEAPLRI